MQHSSDPTICYYWSRRGGAQFNMACQRLHADNPALLCSPVTISSIQSNKYAIFFSPPHADHLNSSSPTSVFRRTPALMSSCCESAGGLHLGLQPFMNIFLYPAVPYTSHVRSGNIFFCARFEVKPDTHSLTTLWGAPVQPLINANI